MPKNPKRPPLTDDQRAAIHDLYVTEGLGWGEIASRLGVGVDQVVRETKRHAAEKLAVDENPAVLAAKRAREAEAAQSRITVEKLCERVSVSYLRAHLKTAKRLEEAAGSEATQLLGRGGVAAALGSPAPVIEKARLTVGLSTEKTELASSVDKYAEALAHWLDESPDDPDGVARPAAPDVAQDHPAQPVPKDGGGAAPGTDSRPR